MNRFSAKQSSQSRAIEHQTLLAKRFEPLYKNSVIVCIKKEDYGFAVVVHPTFVPFAAFCCFSH